MTKKKNHKMEPRGAGHHEHVVLSSVLSNFFLSRRR
jgi:hypothetical protein